MRRPPIERAFTSRNSCLRPAACCPRPTEGPANAPAVSSQHIVQDASGAVVGLTNGAAERTCHSMHITREHACSDMALTHALSCLGKRLTGVGH